MCLALRVRRQTRDRRPECRFHLSRQRIQTLETALRLHADGTASVSASACPPADRASPNRDACGDGTKRCVRPQDRGDLTKQTATSGAAAPGRCLILPGFPPFLRGDQLVCLRNLLPLSGGRIVRPCRSPAGRHFRLCSESPARESSNVKRTGVKTGVGPAGRGGGGQNFGIYLQTVNSGPPVGSCISATVAADRG